MSELQEPAPGIEELLSVIIIQQQRIYDVLLMMFGDQNQEACYSLIEVHKELDNVGPVPFRTEDE